jgi:uncharacterized protein
MVPRVLSAIAVAIALTGCSSSSTRNLDSTAGAAPSDVVRIPLTIDGENGSVTFQAEIADTQPSRTRGLMFRKSMGENEGMLFLFPAEQHLSFWMRNTFIPLDMIFIRADKTILGVVENATPQTDTPRQVPGLSQFVLEVNGGVAARRGIKAGQSVAFYAPLPSS